MLDTHVHLNELNNISQKITDAINLGINGIVAVGTDYISNKINLELSTKYSFIEMKIYLAMGIHPNNIDKNEIGKTIDFIRINSKNIIALGEIGLDYKNKTIDEQDNRVQIHVFETQLELSKEISKPVIIHSRNAWKDCLEIIKNHKINNAVFHWYSGPNDILKMIIDLGYYVSVTPALQYSRGQIDTVKYTPIDRILVETDSPVRYKDELGNFYISEPKDIIRTISLVSKIKNIPYPEIVTLTTENAKKFFKIN